MQPNSFIEQILFSTLRIELYDNHEKSKGIGTGFLVTTEIPDDPNTSLVLMITNRHVLQSNSQFVINFHKRLSGLNQPDLEHTYTVNAGDIRESYYCHPNPDVDLACVNLSSVIDNIRDQIYFRYLPSNLFASFLEPEMDAGTKVIFVGYPDNRYDERHNLPIVRSGIVASHPKIDFNGLPQFIIDAQVFPGSSGSPVFLNNIDAMLNRAIMPMHPITSYIFLGVVSATMIRNNRINFMQTQLKPFAEEIIGLGIVFKSTAVRELMSEAVKGYKSKKLANGT
ncbi:MAG: trypsin-like peptidase domain-containing protein [Ignavibacteriae bacterium]|nr:trypsin-like peptidase domain-containing protein [Ignavibacteria bacterium]MBI3364590.1 trypsin-like peptidase domain-containing protein [Ignavibacteriota bacterium]